MRLRMVVALSTLALAATAQGAASGVSPASGPSPFAPGCEGVEQTGDVFVNAEVEPWVAVDPTNRKHLVAAWQQDRWSNGGARGLLTGVSNDGGVTWTRPPSPPFTRCAGGNATNGGDWQRASDPWVSIARNGVVHQIALAFNDSNADDAVTVSRSFDGGRTWGPITALISETDPTFDNDKQSITADPTDGRFVYAIWDRLEQVDPNADFPDRGPAVLARSTDNGRTWEAPRVIYDPGFNNQTIGHQIVVRPNGDLVDVMVVAIVDQFSVQTLRSRDHGRTWQGPFLVSDLGFTEVTDPRDGELVRTGDIIPDIAVDPDSGDVYVAWQDNRFAPDGASQCLVARSTNGGRSWSRPRVASENPATQAFTCSVEVDGQGNAGVSYYDLTFDTAASEALDTDMWFALSRDHGRHFEPRERLTPTSFDMRLAPNASGFFVGDYEGLVAAGRSFKAVFGASTPDPANPTDIFAATARRPFGSNLVAAAIETSVPTARASLRSGAIAGRFTLRR